MGSAERRGSAVDPEETARGAHVTLPGAFVGRRESAAVRLLDALGNEQAEWIPRDDSSRHRSIHLGVRRRIVVGKDSERQMRKSLGSKADEVLSRDR